MSYYGNKPLPDYSKDLLGNIVSTKRVKRKVLSEKYRISGSGRSWRKLKKWLRRQGREI